MKYDSQQTTDNKNKTFEINVDEFYTFVNYELLL